MLRLQRATRAALAAPLAATLLAAAAGCNGSSSDPTGTTAPIVGLRIVQGVSDAANGVDFSLNGAVAVSGLPIGTFLPTTATYSQINPGTQLAFTATGRGAPFYSQVVPTTSNATTAYTLISYGRVTAGSGPAATAALLTDTLGVTSGAVLLRAFNAVDYVTPGSGTAVDIYVYAQGASRPTSPTVARLAYGTSSGYVTSVVGNLQMDVLAAGSASTATPLFSTGLVTGTGSIRTLVLLDPPTSSSSPGVLVLADAP